MGLALARTVNVLVLGFRVLHAQVLPLDLLDQVAPQTVLAYDLLVLALILLEKLVRIAFN